MELNDEPQPSTSQTIIDNNNLNIQIPQDYEKQTVINEYYSDVTSPNTINSKFKKFKNVAFKNFINYFIFFVKQKKGLN